MDCPCPADSIAKLQDIRWEAASGDHVTTTMSAQKNVKDMHNLIKEVKPRRNNSFCFFPFFFQFLCCKVKPSQDCNSWSEAQKRDENWLGFSEPTIRTFHICCHEFWILNCIARKAQIYVVDPDYVRNVL